MLTHPILDQINTLKLTGMHKALSEQIDMDEVDSMDFMTRLGLMVDREITERANRRLQTRLKKAKLRQQACSRSMTKARRSASSINIESMRISARRDSS